MFHEDKEFVKVQIIKYNIIEVLVKYVNKVDRLKVSSSTCISCIVKYCIKYRHILLKVTKLQTYVEFNELYELNFVCCEFNFIR